MILLVTGGRQYYGGVFKALDAIHASERIDIVVHGACRTGADALAKEWAAAHGVRELPFRAEWRVHGNAAGPIRNTKMVDECNADAFIAFPGGDGTRDCTNKALAKGIRQIAFP